METRNYTILYVARIMSTCGVITMMMNRSNQNIVRYSNRRILLIMKTIKETTRLLKSAKSKERGIWTPFVSFIWLPLPRSYCNRCNRSMRIEVSRLILVRTSASHLHLHLKVRKVFNSNEEQKYCSLPDIFSLVNWIWSASSNRGELITGQSY